MKHIYLILLSMIVLASCQKTITDFDPSQKPGTDPGTTTPTSGSGSFVATVNGQQLNFAVSGATLLRSTVSNEKRMDIVGTSPDGKQRISITLAEETAKGNGVTVKKYVLNAFPPDDPSTPTIDESLYTEGFTMYGTNLGNDTWLYDLYEENGSLTVTACDESSKLVSGTFQTSLVGMIDTTKIVKITAGKLTNIKYTVLN